MGEHTLHTCWHIATCIAATSPTPTADLEMIEAFNKQ